LETVVEKMDVSKPNFLEQTMRLYAHPSTILWRAIEAREVYGEFSRRNLKRPVLDLGCGDGRFSRTAFGGSSIDVGIDIVRTALSKARGSGSYSCLVIGDGSRLPFRDRSFETIFSNSVLEHIPNVDDALQEIQRVLKDGGFLVFTVPSTNFARYLFPSTIQRLRFFSSIIEWYGEKRNAMLQHANIFPASAWTNQLMSQGFASVQVKYCISKDAIRLWDAMALIVYVIGIAVQKFPRGTTQAVANASQRMRVTLLGAVLRKFYRAQAADGGDLIVVARK
jgi:ubiquinone/menaquinone biosynthesis C-methylase UbiE